MKQLLCPFFLLLLVIGCRPDHPAATPSSGSLMLSIAPLSNHVPTAGRWNAESLNLKTRI